MQQYFWNSQISDVRAAQIDSLITQLKIYAECPIEKKLKPVKQENVSEIVDAFEAGRELNLFVEKFDDFDGLVSATNAFVELNNLCEIERTMSEKLPAAMKLYSRTIGDDLLSHSQELTDSTVPRKQRAALFGELVTTSLLRHLNVDVTPLNAFLVVRVFNALDLRGGVQDLTLAGVQDPVLKSELVEFWPRNFPFVGDRGDSDRWAPQGLPHLRPSADVEYLAAWYHRLKLRIGATKLEDNPALFRGKRSKLFNNLVGLASLVLYVAAMAVITFDDVPSGGIGNHITGALFLGALMFSPYFYLSHLYRSEAARTKCNRCGTSFSIMNVESTFQKHGTRAKTVQTKELIKDARGKELGHIEGEKTISERVSIFEDKRCCLTCGYTFKGKSVRS